MRQHHTILIISHIADNLKSVAGTLQQTGYNVLFARDGREGLRLTRRETPDLVISEIDLPIISGLELCRIIRRDKDLWTLPLLFLCTPGQDSKSLNEILRAGADELLTGFSNPEYLAVRTAWLIEQKYSENNLTHFYEILRGRQTQMTQIIRDTCSLFHESEAEYSADYANENNSRTPEKNIGESIKLGINTISALANLLEEQIKALDIWRRPSCEDEFGIESNVLTSELNYDDLTFNFIKDDLPAH